MTSAIYLIIVVCCCMYTHAGPYYGRSPPEIEDYDYTLENEDYQYPDDDDLREAAGDRDMSFIQGSGGGVNRYPGRSAPRYGSGGYPGRYPLQKYKSTGRFNRRNGSLKYQFPRRSNRRNVGIYNENINIHDTRDIWGQYPQSGADSYGQGSDSGDHSGEYWAESKDYVDWNGKPGNSGSTEDVDLPDIIDHVEEDDKRVKPSKRPGKPSKRPGKPSKRPGKPNNRPTKPSTRPGRPSKRPGKPTRPGKPATKPATPATTPKELSEEYNEDPQITERPPKITPETPSTPEELSLASEELPVESEAPIIPDNPPAAPEHDLLCTNGRRSLDSRYSMSFPSEIDSSEPIHTKSVHKGGDLTLCWIETVTTKEDNSTEPPKRLVVREYTITFENSVQIPDEYLECPKIDGEIRPITKDEVNNTQFQEYFATDAKKSKVTVLNKVYQEDNLTVTEEKTIRCGSGSLITKDVYEWLDVPDKPVRRVEIKVGPVLKSVTDDSEEDLTSTDVPDPAITVDCFIDGTCSTAGNDSTITTTIGSSSSSEDGTSGSSETSCESGDEDCIKPSVLPIVEGIEEEGSQEIGSTGQQISADLTQEIGGNSSMVEPASGELGDGTESVSITDEISTTTDDSKEPEVTTPAESIEEENSSTENIIATTVSRRTTFSSTASIEDDHHKPRYSLKLRVILERTDKNDEKQTLVNLKKEMPLSHENRTYMDQLDALNDSISDLAVIRDLLNSSAFKSVLPIVWGYVGSGSEEDDSASRSRRSALVESSMKTPGTDDVLEQWLPDIQKDISTGLKAMKKQILENSGGDILRKESDVVSTTTWDFDTGGLRSRRSTDEDSEAISQWSHERFRDGSDGGQMRSFTEVLIHKSSEV